MSIDDLFGSAWNNAINSIADVLGYELDTCVSVIDNWQELENIARKLSIKFNENGYIK